MKLKYITVILLGVFGTSYAATENIAVDAIKITQANSTEASNDFSMTINFSNSGDEIKKWQFGFYMPRSFDSTLSQNLNPKLTMQICSFDDKCVNLRYVVNKDIKSPDASQGSLTILEPVREFALGEKQNYYIKLTDNNQGRITNYSAFPQSLFLIEINPEKKSVYKIHNIPTDMEKYEIAGVDQQQIENSINERITKNWESGVASKDSMVNVVPLPRNVKELAGSSFIIPSAKQKVFIQNDMPNIESGVLTYWSGVLQKDWNLKYKVSQIIDSDVENKTVITIDEISSPQLINNNPEGYVLEINGQNINIEAMTSAGVYYAFETLRQLYQAKAELPAMQIIDYPSLDYRGVMLDVARHYFTVSEIKKMIDVMASTKMNTLHLHLSDDEAFRVALANYPTLQTVAATRGYGEDIGANWLLQNNLDTTNLSQHVYPSVETKYSGSYSASDLQDIIRYANLKQITVIPEIDVPGHARALIKALPDEMIDHNDNTQTISIQGYRNNVLPICTYGSSLSVGHGFTEAINHITTEIAQIFDNQTTVHAVNSEISVGGDEVPQNSWSDSSSCTGDWADMNTYTALDKSQLFFSRVSEENKSLKISGWQQIVQEDNDSKIGKNALGAEHIGHVWVWNSSKGGVNDAITLADKGYPTVLAFADKSYFDIAYNPSMTEPGFTWSSKNMDSYNVLSMAQDVAKVRSKVSQPGLIRGVEGTLWSENLPSFDHLMYMALPKIPALSEVAWSYDYSAPNKNNEWQDFAKRMGCGKSGYLHYVNKTYQVNYRGYPNGITKEIPVSAGICSDKVDDLDEEMTK